MYMLLDKIFSAPNTATCDVLAQFQLCRMLSRNARAAAQAAPLAGAAAMLTDQATVAAVGLIRLAIQNEAEDSNDQDDGKLRTDCGGQMPCANCDRDDYGA